MTSPEEQRMYLRIYANLVWAATRFMGKAKGPRRRKRRSVAAPIQTSLEYCFQLLEPRTCLSAPTIAIAAAASPSPVTSTTSNLSVLGADDDGEANLTYTWATTGTPPASVSFSSNS